MKISVFLVVLSFSLLISGCGNTINTANDETSDSTEGNVTAKQETLENIPEETTDCRQCGMPSEDFKQWRGCIETQNGSKLRTCCPRCLFLSVLNEDKAPKNIRSLTVTDYYESKEINAKAAFYVIKSEKIGPMGHDLVPFETQAAAEEFLKDYKGKKIVRFHEVNLPLIQELTEL